MATQAEQYADILERVAKLAPENAVMLPEVAQQIERLWALRKFDGPEKEHRTITHVDLQHALTLPSAKIVDLAQEDDAYSATIKSVDASGWLLAVMVIVPIKAGDPLVITGFAPLAS